MHTITGTQHGSRPRTRAGRIKTRHLVKLLLFAIYTFSLFQGANCLVHAFQPKVIISNFQQPRLIGNTMGSTINKTVDNSNSVSNVAESAVLSELKDIVRKQAAEIIELKKRQTTVPGTQQHSLHGGGGDISLDDIAAYLEKPFYRLARKRVGWLSLFLGSLSLTAVIMSGFEHTLSKQIELAYFVPLLAGHGGNTGGQTVGTVLSALSAGSIQLEDAPRVVGKEALSGFMVGAILGVAVCPIAHYVMGISVHVSTVILLTLPLVSTIAATLGSAIPFFCIWAGLDPSVIAAPAMTSFVDVTGLISYFLIANQVFHMFGIDL